MRRAALLAARLLSVTLALGYAVTSDDSAAQGRPSTPSSNVPRSGIGISIDLRSLFGLASVLANASTQRDAHVSGRLLAVADALPDPAVVQDIEGVRSLARLRLQGLGLDLYDLSTVPGQEATVADALRGRLPVGAEIDRPAWLDPQRGAEPRRSGRVYALAKIGLPASDPSERPVRLAIIDAAPSGRLPLQGDLRIVRFDGDAQSDGHSDRILCLLACPPTPDAAFRGLLSRPEITAVAIMERTPEGTLRGHTAGLARALDYLILQGISVVNLSLGGVGDRVQRAVVARALARGLILVAAAGNGGEAAPPVYPAAWPGVIAVAAVDAAGKPWPRGNRGTYIAIAAPGVDLWLPTEGGEYVSGTSFASPFVAARLAWAQANGQTSEREALCARARDLGPPGRDPETGCGLMIW